MSTRLDSHAPLQPFSLMFCRFSRVEINLLKQPLSHDSKQQVQTGKLISGEKKITAHLNKLNHNSVLEGGKDATTVNKRAELVLNVSGAFLHNKGGHMLIHDWCC